MNRHSITQALTATTLILALFLTLATSPAEASEEAQWRQKQTEVVGIVRQLTRAGATSAYRCGLYVPGIGVCYMKMVPQTCESGHNSPNVSPVYANDIAEMLDVATLTGKKKILGSTEYVVFQTRFTNTAFLRLLSKELVGGISAVTGKNLLAYKKLLEDVVTYVDGNLGDQKKTDVWVSVVTEKFNRGAIPLNTIPGEGLIIPDKAIVLYHRFPGLYRTGGEKALADKLMEVYKSSEPLKKFYKNYQLAVGVESDNQLLFAQYNIEECSSITRDKLKYHRFDPKLKK